MARSRRAFTLIELLTVMAVIAIIVGMVLSIHGLVQRKGASSRAEVEIKALGTACDNYKADNGGYPQDVNSSDILNPKTSGNPTAYEAASLFLYKELSGDKDANGVTDLGKTPPEGPIYAPEFFKPDKLEGTKVDGRITKVLYIRDPFGYSYGYSTKGAAAEQTYQAELRTTPTKPRPAAEGYNPTYDLWSTAGKTVSPSSDPGITNVWIKNW